MNFFRLRFINTLLLFLIGIVLGFIVKDRFYPAPKAAYQSAYRPAGVQPSEEGDEPAEAVPAADDSDAADDEEETPAAPARAARPAAARDNGGEPLVIEAGDKPGEDQPAKEPVLRDSDDKFFRRPADYDGRELEMELQMITARRSQRGWRLNFVYTGPDKKIDYLYVDDDEVLGDKPDLRIGYVYKVHFRCGRGRTDAGNSLVGIKATGDKAAWATGLSAVE